MPVSPQLALRVGDPRRRRAGAVRVIFFRLWYLQVLTGEQYVQQANANRVRDLPIPAPRGEILDRDGAADRRPAARPTRCRSCPRRCRRRARARMRAVRRARARCSGMSGAHIAGARHHRAARPCRYAPVTIKTDAGRGVLTRARRAPERIPRRGRSSRSRSATTRTATMAAQVLGYVGQIIRTGAEDARASRASSRARSSARRARGDYDHYLRGKPGVAARRGQRRRATRCRANLAPTRRRPATASR